jgi:hypothetical protein
MVSRRTATINQIRAFLIEQGIAVRTGARALHNSLMAILENRQDEISIRMRTDDWISVGSPRGVGEARVRVVEGVRALASTS